MLAPTFPSTAAQAPTSPAPVAPALVPFQRPEPPKPVDIMAYYAMAEDARYYSNGGPCARLLTERLESSLGDGPFVVPVGTSPVGLMAALRAAGGPPPPERRAALTPAYPFPATACAIDWAGFEPVFV